MGTPQRNETWSNLPLAPPPVQKGIEVRCIANLVADDRDRAVNISAGNDLDQVAGEPPQHTWKTQTSSMGDL